MKRFHTFASPKRTQTDRKRIKNLAVRVFFFYICRQNCDKVTFQDIIWNHLTFLIDGYILY